jgi:hypothetical protein
MLQDKSPKVANDVEKRVEMGSQPKKYKTGESDQNICNSAGSTVCIASLVKICSHLIRCKYTEEMIKSDTMPSTHLGLEFKEK